MSKQAPATGFSASERDYIRRELDMFFSTLPTVAEGFQLKTWRGGPQAGRPKVPPVARSLIDRGLMRLDTSDRLPRPPPRRPETFRPCPPGAWHRPEISDGPGAGVTEQPVETPSAERDQARQFLTQLDRPPRLNGLFGRSTGIVASPAKAR
jgi:hypothetical protein